MPRKVYPFWLILLALCLTLSACSQPTPILDNQAATPTRNVNATVTVPATPVVTDTGLNKGTLKEIFPTLATLPDQVQAIHIRPALADMVWKYQLVYDFYRSGQDLKGYGSSDIYLWGGPGAGGVSEMNKEFKLSSEETRQFVSRLIETPVEDGPYKGGPIARKTDFDPSLNIEIETSRGSLLFYSDSQNSDFSPWTVSFAGRSFTATDATPFEVYHQLEPVLQPKSLLLDLNNPFPEPSAKPVSSAPPPALNPLKPQSTWQILNSAGESRVSDLAFSPVANLWVIPNSTQMISANPAYTFTYALGLLENNPAHSRVKTLNAQEVIQKRDAGLKTLGNFAFSPDGKYLAGTAGGGGIEYSREPIFVWDVATGRLVARLMGHEKTVTALTFSADSHTLVSASPDRTVRVWSIPDGKNVITLRPSFPQMYGFLAVAISPDEQQIAAAGRGDYWMADFPIKIWQLNKAASPPTELTLKGHKSPVTNLAFGPDGQAMVSVDEAGSIYSWNNTSGQGWQLRNHQDNLSVITSLSLSQDGKQIATGHRDGTLRLWSATDLKLLSVTTVSKLDKDRWFRPQVFFSQDGQTILTCDTATGAFAQWSTNP